MTRRRTRLLTRNYRKPFVVPERCIVGDVFVSQESR